MNANVVTLPRPALVAVLRALYASAPSDREARLPVLQLLLDTAHAASGMRAPARLSPWHLERDVVGAVEALLACSLTHVETQPLGPLTYTDSDPRT